MCRKMNAQSKGQGFTLIELLVVVAIISLLAAILFPVFARARENARRGSCMSNMKQIGIAMLMYAQDYDEHLASVQLRYGLSNVAKYPNKSTSPDQYWYNAIYPYIKNYQVYNCPSADSEITYKGGVVWQDGFNYAYNYHWPALGSGDTCASNRNCGISLGPPLESGANLAAVEDTAGTIMITESSSPLAYFRKDRTATVDTVRDTGACFKLPNATYYQDCFRARHFDSMNVLFVDGHVKSMKWQTILGNTSNLEVVKYWTTASNPLK